MKESMKQSNQSKSIKKTIHKNNSNQQMKSPPTEEHQISNKPIKEEQSESEINSVFNIEQEDSIIKLNDQFQRQASKKAFAQLYELDDCLEEMQDKNYSMSLIESTKIRKIENIDQFLKQEEWEEEEEKKSPFDFNPELEYQQLIDQKNLNHSIELRVSHNFQWLIKEVSHYEDGLRFLLIRKIIITIIISLEILSYKLLQSTIFDLYEMLVTLANIILFLNRSTQESPKISQYQYLFCALYFIDAVILLKFQINLKQISLSILKIHFLIEIHAKHANFKNINDELLYFIQLNLKYTFDKIYLKISIS